MWVDDKLVDDGYSSVCEQSIDIDQISLRYFSDESLHLFFCQSISYTALKPKQ